MSKRRAMVRYFQPSGIYRGLTYDGRAAVRTLSGKKKADKVEEIPHVRTYARTSWTLDIKDSVTLST